MPSNYERRIDALESAIGAKRCEVQCAKCWLAQDAAGSGGIEFAGCDGRPACLADVLTSAADDAIVCALLGSGAVPDLSDESLRACAEGRQ